MTDIDLDAIEARIRRWDWCSTLEADALVAEIRRLRVIVEAQKADFRPTGRWTQGRSRLARLAHKLDVAYSERDEARAEVERLRNIVGETGPQCSRCGHQEGKHYYGDRGPDGCRECNGDHTFTPTDGGEVAQALLGVVLGVVCFVMLLWRLSS